MVKTWTTFYEPVGNKQQMVLGLMIWLTHVIPVGKIFPFLTNWSMVKILVQATIALEWMPLEEELQDPKSIFWEKPLPVLPLLTEEFNQEILTWNQHLPSTPHRYCFTYSSTKVFSLPFCLLVQCCVYILCVLCLCSFLALLIYFLICL